MACFLGPIGLERLTGSDFFNSPTVPNLRFHLPSNPPPRQYAEAANAKKQQ